MWKTIVLCASLFSGGVVGLAAAARWIEPAALPAAAAIGLCLIGIVLILAAPTTLESEEDKTMAAGPRLRGAFAQSSPSLKSMDSPASSPRTASGGTGKTDSLLPV